MKYRLRAEIEGTLFLEAQNSNVAAKRNGWEFRLESDESGRICALSVTAPIPEEIAAEFEATAEFTPAAATAAKLRFNVSLEFHESLVHELQAMESLLAFTWKGHPVKHIKWNEAEKSLIPETPEEETRVDFSSMKWGRRVPVTQALVRPDEFARLVARGPMFGELTIPTAFWREGMNHMDRREFVQAFHNYYFVIEDFFADGKTGERPVLRAFRGSELFTEICEEALETPLFVEQDDHAEQLDARFASEGCTRDVPGLQQFLFRMRGNTHHYFGKSSRPHPTPFNQGEFESVALLAMWVTTVSIARKIALVSASHGDLPSTPDGSTHKAPGGQRAELKPVEGGENDEEE